MRLVLNPAPPGSTSPTGVVDDVGAGRGESWPSALAASVGVPEWALKWVWMQMHELAALRERYEERLRRGQATERDSSRCAPLATPGDRRVSFGLEVNTTVEFDEDSFVGRPVGGASADVGPTTPTMTPTPTPRDSRPTGEALSPIIRNAAVPYSDRGAQVAADAKERSDDVVPPPLAPSPTLAPSSSAGAAAQVPPANVPAWHPLSGLGEFLVKKRRMARRAVCPLEAMDEDDDSSDAASDYDSDDSLDSEDFANLEVRIKALQRHVERARRAALRKHEKKDAPEEMAFGVAHHAILARQLSDSGDALARKRHEQYLAQRLLEVKTLLMTDPAKLWGEGAPPPSPGVKRARDEPSAVAGAGAGAAPSEGPEESARTKRFSTVDVVKPVEIFVPGFRPIENARGPEFYAPRKSAGEGASAGAVKSEEGTDEPAFDSEEDISDEAMHALHRQSYKDERKLYLGALLEQAKAMEEDVKTGRKSHKKITERTCSLTGDVIFDKRSAAESNVGGGHFLEDRLDAWVLKGLGPFRDDPVLAEADYVEDLCNTPRGVSWPRSPYLEATGYYERREAMFSKRREAKARASAPSGGAGSLPGGDPSARASSSPRSKGQAPQAASPPESAPQTRGVKLVLRRSPPLKAAGLPAVRAG